MRKLPFILLLMSLSLVSCQNERGFKEDKVFLGKQKVKAETLSLGKQVYLEYCMGCHGMKGDGNGPAAVGSLPAPRNFKQGLYKFGYVKDGGLPSDADFKRIIQKGLHGTGMLKWDISDAQTFAVTQYIKTFAPQVWEDEENTPGETIEFTKDPYTVARKNYAIQYGKEVYHAVANCQTCHRAYITKDELNIYNKKYNDEVIADEDFEEDLYVTKLQDSEYYFHDSEDRTMQYLPPDFTYNYPRSADNVEGYYKRLKAGVTGSTMASWDGVLTEAQIWAVSYYVESLTKLRETKERAALQKKLLNQ